MGIVIWVYCGQIELQCDFIWFVVRQNILWNIHCEYIV